MSYNDRVSKAMKTVGKESKLNNIQNMAEYKADLMDSLEKIKLKRLQYTYGRFLDKGTMTKNEFKQMSNASEHLASDVLKELMKKGLISAEIINTQTRQYQFTIVDDKRIPEGWPAKGELIMMKSPYFRFESRKTAIKTEQEKMESKIINNPMTRMLRNMNDHVMDVTPYKQLMEDTKRFYGNEEVDSLISALHEICRTRIEQQYIACPLCKGRIQRNKSEAVCTNCGAKINGGTFEKSMEMLKILGKAGVRMA